MAWGGFFREQDFHRPSFSTEAGGEDFGVVEQEKVFRADPSPEFVEAGMGERSVLPIDHQQAGVIPGVGRLAGDEVRGEVELIVGKEMAHGGGRVGESRPKPKSEWEDVASNQL
jgi:hypothetical protein